MNNTSVEFTAGLGGFLVVFGLALAVWLLGRDLTRRLRRMRLREQERLAALEAERGRATGPAAVAGEAPPEAETQTLDVGPEDDSTRDERDPLA